MVYVIRVVGRAFAGVFMFVIIYSFSFLGFCSFCLDKCIIV